MSYYVYLNKCENFNQKDFNHKEAEDVGLLLLGLGIKDIKKNYIKELVFRCIFLQKVAYNRADTVHTPAQVTKLFNKYIGLETNGVNITRTKFITNMARGLERDVEYNMNWKQFHRVEQPKEVRV